jgi:hypothetical protein
MVPTPTVLHRFVSANATGTSLSTADRLTIVITRFNLALFGLLRHGIRSIQVVAFTNSTQHFAVLYQAIN